MADPWEQFKRAGTQGATQFSGLGRLAVDPRKLADVAIAAGEMVAAPVRAAADILTNYNPGAENEPLNEDIGRQGFTAGPGALSPGALRAGAGRGAGELGVFGGRGAGTADTAALARAEDMAARGATREEIWSETGWFQGADNKWRFEIDDSASRFRGVPSKVYGDAQAKLPDALEHPQLYAAYPEGKKIAVGLGEPQGRATWNADQYPSGAVRLSEIDAKTNPDSARRLTLHEGQHFIQDVEGFTPGWSANSPLTPGARAAIETEANRLLASIPFHPSVSAKARQAVALHAAEREVRKAQYHMSAGEVEARNVERRADMTPAERHANPPWKTEDVPTAQQIIRESFARNANPQAAGSGPSGKIGPEEVAQMMRELGYENVRVAPAKTGDSTYVSGDPYGNQPRPGSPRPLVRIPADEHIGRPARGSEAGSRFDTGTSPEFRDNAPRQVPADERVTLNQGGEPYADPEALRAALEWRAGGLVRPDQAPRGVRQQPPLDTPAPEPRAGPDNLPGQGRLLASGAAPINAWDTEISREDAGRFSRALASPDDQLVSDTRELTGRVAAAVDEGNPGRFSRQVASVWDQFQRYGPEFEETLRGIDALDPGYHPGERMSDNVVDLRKPRSLWVEMRDQMLGRGF